MPRRSRPLLLTLRGVRSRGVRSDPESHRFLDSDAESEAEEPQNVVEPQPSAALPASDVPEDAEAEQAVADLLFGSCDGQAEAWPLLSSPPLPSPSR